MTKSNGYHDPVLLQSCLEGLVLKPGGVYVDVTFGGGGHSKAILEAESDLDLVAFDQDPDAKQNIPEDSRLTFVPANFRHLKRFLRLEGFVPVDGILADLGVSSYQIDTAERGFSTRFDGPLDMRMDKSASLSASDYLATVSQQELQEVLSKYGDIRNARTLSEKILQEQSISPLTQTQDLARVASSVSRGPENKYLAKVFQAIRIAVNDEEEVLKDFLEQSLEVLKPGGRLVIMSYHSLEDRLVKNFFRWGSFDKEPEKDLYGNYPKPFKLITRKPIVADDEEIKRNPRARSAKLRIAEKI